MLLGSTGSVGTQAADVIRRNPGRFRITGLAAGGSNPDLLAAQAIEFGVGVVAVAQESAAGDVREALKAHAVRAGRPRTGQWPTALTGQRLALPARPGAHSGPGHAGGGDGPAAGGDGQAGDGRAPLPTVVAGPDAIAEVAAWPADVVLNAVTGFSGLAATLAALRAGRVLALANKESLITGGPLVAGLAAPGQIVPVDSEHSAIAQCLRCGTGGEVARLVLTASGGPFRGRDRAELEGITPEQALAHPTWNMGPVITINSATLVNKGLEVIEAHLLFGLGFDKIKVVVHPQSVIHSMVEFTDGSTIAQASPLTCGSRSRWPWAGRTGCRAPPRPSTGPPRTPGPSSHWTRTRSPRSASRGGRGRRAGPPRPPTTPPTRCASVPSWRAGSPSSRSWTPWRR